MPLRPVDNTGLSSCLDEVAPSLLLLENEEHRRGGTYCSEKEKKKKQETKSRNVNGKS